MDITYKPAQPAPGCATDQLDEIEAIIGQARSGALPEEAAFDAIGRIVRRRTAAAPEPEIYQKPWG